MAAVMAFSAGPIQTGQLAAIAAAPAIITGLFGGPFVDRVSRRRVLIGADLARAGVLLVVPLAALSRHLALAEIYLAAVIIGAASNLFDMADHAYLPGLVDQTQLMEANARLGATESLGEVAGPALAGALFNLLTAPIALAVNAATYLASAALLATIRRPESAPSTEATDPSLASPLEGARICLAEPLTRPLLILTALETLFGGFFAALYVFYALKTLGLTPALLGLTIAAGGVGALVGAAAAGRVSDRLGVGPALIAAALAAGGCALFIPLAHGTPLHAMTFLVIAQFFGDGFATAALIYGITIRQSVLPPAKLGRAAGAFIAVGGLALVAGALGGGQLAQRIGPRPALYIATAGLIAAPLVCLASPLRRLRQLATST